MDGKLARLYHVAPRDQYILEQAFDCSHEFLPESCRQKVFISVKADSGQDLLILPSILSHIIRFMPGLASFIKFCFKQKYVLSARLQRVSDIIHAVPQTATA